MKQVANLDPNLSINPSAEQAAAFFALDPASPVVFVNLHRYYDRARYPTDYHDPRLPSDVSGREAYHRYLGEVERRYLPQVGARFLIVAPVELLMIGDGEWDEAVLGLYPSKAAAMRLPTLPGYADLAIHRLAGLAAALTVALGPEALERFPIASVRT
jgi:hypothetical protein